MRSRNYFVVGILIVFLLLSSDAVICEWYSLWGNQQAPVPGIPEAESMGSIYKTCIEFASKLSPQEVRVEKSKDCEQMIHSYLETLKNQQQKNSPWFFGSSSS